MSRIVVLVDDSGCYFLDVLSISDDVDVASERAIYHLKPGRNDSSGSRFADWLIRKGLATRPDYDTIDVREPRK